MVLCNGFPDAVVRIHSFLKRDDTQGVCDLARCASVLVLRSPMCLFSSRLRESCGLLFE